MRVSIKDIAQALNVSKATVSWILSGQGPAKGFSEATIKRVKEYAESVNYRPNLLARSLSLGTSHTIGLVIPFIGDTFYAQVVQAIESEAAKNNYVLTVCSSEGNSDREFELVKVLKSKQVDGIILAPTKKSQACINMLMQDAFPFVLVDRYFPEINTNYVIVDNEQSSYELVQHLIRKRCRKIVLLTTDVHLFVMNLRINGYRKALADYGLPNEGLEVTVQRENYKHDLVTQLDLLFAGTTDVDGFYFSTHYLALEALRYFITHKIDYQHRFELACFHETEALDILAPTMSISHMPIDSIGIKSVRMLIENIQDKEYVPQGIVLKNTYSF